jgi:hypothetical protein
MEAGVEGQGTQPSLSPGYAGSSSSPADPEPDVSDEDARHDFADLRTARIELVAQPASTKIVYEDPSRRRNALIDRYRLCAGDRLLILPTRQPMTIAELQALCD